MPENSIYPSSSSDEKTQLVNLRHFDLDDVDTYIGEESDTYDLSKSPFSNPFDKAEYGRDDAVKHFKLYLYRRYLEEKDFRMALHEIEGDVLGCWCYPRRCHGEVIVDILNKHMEEGTKGTIDYMEHKLENEIDNSDLGAQGFKELEAAQEAIEEARKRLDLD